MDGWALIHQADAMREMRRYNASLASAQAEPDFASGYRYEGRHRNTTARVTREAVIRALAWAAVEAVILTVVVLMIVTA